MFELTATLNYVVPVMLGVLVAKTVANALEPKGIYDLCIEYVAYCLSHHQFQREFLQRLAQLPYLDGKSEHLWGGLQAGDAVSEFHRLGCRDSHVLSG